MRTLIVFLALCGAASANDWYVSPTGSDSNPGTAAQPFRQISKAITVVQPGDTVYVADGTYNGGLTITKVATAGSPIVFQATGANAEVLPGGTDTIFISGSAYVTLDGLRSFNANRAAVRISQSHHVTVKNGVFGDNARWGIFTDFSDDLLLEGNECYGSGLEHGIYHSNSGDRPTIRRNRLHHNNANGLHMNGDINIQPGDGIISQALVEENVIWENGVAGGSGINCDGVVNSTIRNNLLYDNHAGGITLYRIDGGSPSTNNVVCNNTVVVASDGRWAMTIHDGSTGTRLFNNLFLTRHAWRGSLHFSSAADLSGLVSDYNVLTTNANAVTTDDDSTYLTVAQWKALGYDGNSTAATEGSVFASSATHDYHLKAGSPALDSGVAGLGGGSAPGVDYEGGLRPTDGGYDRGADEHNAAGGGGGGGGGGGASGGGGGGGGGGKCGLTGMEVVLVLVALAMRRRHAPVGARSDAGPSAWRRSRRPNAADGIAVP